jgi:hypothetical protein
MSILTIYVWSSQIIGLPRTLAACGIVLAVFGAGVLYWETVAEIQELKRVSNEIDLWGSSTKLSLGEIGGVLAFAGLGFWIGYLQAAVVVLSAAKHNPNHLGLYTVLRAVGAFIIYALPPAFGAYGVAKWQRRFCSRWAERFRVSQDRTAEIKRFLRLIGFASLFFAGIAQLPATLFGSH